MRRQFHWERAVHLTARARAYFAYHRTIIHLPKNERNKQFFFIGNTATERMKSIFIGCVCSPAHIVRHGIIRVRATSEVPKNEEKKKRGEKQYVFGWREFYSADLFTFLWRRTLIQRLNSIWLFPLTTFLFFRLSSFDSIIVCSSFFVSNFKRIDKSIFTLLSARLALWNMPKRTWENS